VSWVNTIEEISPEVPPGTVLVSDLGTLIWRDVAMTPSRRLILHPGATTPAGETWPLLRRLEGGGGLTPAELSALPEARSVAVMALMRTARTDGRAALSLLGLLRPELEAMGRRLVRLGVERDEAEALVVSVAWEVVSGRRSPRCPRSTGQLVESVWRVARQEAGVRRQRLEMVPLEADDDVSVPVVDRLERWPGLLASAVAAGVLTPRQVVIVAQTRMEERPLAEVARALGRPYGAVRKERLRAEAALRAFALTYGWTLW
jgi:hypothetical protein